MTLLIACGGAPEQGTPKGRAIESALCSLNSNDPTTWLACAGKRVSVVGDPPTQPLAHPRAGGPSVHQSYLDFGDVQLVIGSKIVPECTGPRRVTGRLNRIDLGGKTGTRQSYRGWSITQAEIVCQSP